MTVDLSKVRVAVTGAVSKGALAATAPTGTASAISGFTDLGGISEEGVRVQLPDAGDATPIKIWQNGQTARVVRQASDDLPTVTLKMVETSVATIETHFDCTVTQTSTEGSFEYKVQTRSAKSYVVDVIDGAELIRVYIPRGVVASVGEIQFAGTDAIGYEVTIECELNTAGTYNLKTWMTALKSA